MRSAKIPVLVAERQQDLNIALRAAVDASSLAVGYFERGVESSVKHDGTVVTQADHAVEALLRDELAVQRPDDAILGEEAGSTGGGRRRWILDPIDGTRNFVSGRVDWGVHVALEVDAEIVIGIVTRPAAGMVWWAQRGTGAYRAPLDDPFQAERLSVSSNDELSACRLTSWLDGDPGAYRRLEALPGWQTPADLNVFLAVAEGSLDVVVERSPARIWDRAPFVVLVEEAGGRFRDLNGGRDPDTSGCTLTNGLLDDQIAALLTG